MINFENGKIPINDTNLNTMQADLQKEIRGTVIYENVEGTTEDITLLETSLNFKKIEIFYKYSNVVSSVMVESPNGKKASLNLGFTISQYNVARFQYKVILINEASITTEQSGYIAISQDKSIDANVSDNKIVITKVIGYKEV